MKALFLSLLLFFTALGAQDKTPYKFIFAGNSYTGPKNANITWLAERYDCAISGIYDWPGMHDSIYDTALAMGKEFWWGPYASSQELNLYDRFHPERQYGDRLTDIELNWLYIYAKRYMDSVGVSPESLVVHISDDNVNITQDGDGNRSYTLAGLPYHKRRFTYQYWNNTPSDTMFYPAGYCWLANGFNSDARRAIAYAYRRHFIEDSAAYGPGDNHWTAFFMDNQYREGFAPRCYSYYDINSTSGGPTAGLDWYEQPGIGSSVPANTHYYDYSTMLIDSTIKAVLDSACEAGGLKRIHGFSNVDKFSPIHLSVQLRHTHVTLEHPVDYAKAWPNGWAQWYAMADTMAAHPDRYICWLFAGDFLCSSDPGDWRYDSSRIYMAHYAFFLQVRDTNAFMAPHRFNDTARWRDIYEVDLGDPDGPAYEVGSIGSGYDKIAVMRRDYDNGNVAVLLRTSHGQADWIRDSVAVNMHALYDEIDCYGNVSQIPDSVFYLKPYMGRVLKKAAGSSPVITDPSPRGGVCFIDSTVTLGFTVSDMDGLDSLRVWLIRPNDDLLLDDRAFAPDVISYSFGVPYTWRAEDCGFNYLAVYARDDSGNVNYNPEVIRMTTLYETVGINDAVFLIDYIYRMGPPPDPYLDGDANCDGEINVVDPIYIINHIFHGGPPICCPRQK